MRVFQHNRVLCLTPWGISADIHFHRARLFFCETNYPWESPQKDLAEARRLIENHDYWRRKEELEDPEETILGKPKH